jgi:hypothetical protein
MRSMSVTPARASFCGIGRRILGRHRERGVVDTLREVLEGVEHDSARLGLEQTRIGGRPLQDRAAGRQ